MGRYVASGLSVTNTNAHIHMCGWQSTQQYHPMHCITDKVLSVRERLQLLAYIQPAWPHAADGFGVDLGLI